MPLKYHGNEMVSRNWILGIIALLMVETATSAPWQPSDALIQQGALAGQQVDTNRFRPVVRLDAASLGETTPVPLIGIDHVQHKGVFYQAFIIEEPATISFLTERYPGYPTAAHSMLWLQFAGEEAVLLVRDGRIEHRLADLVLSAEAARPKGVEFRRFLHGFDGTYPLVHNVRSLATEVEFRINRFNHPVTFEDLLLPEADRRLHLLENWVERSENWAFRVPYGTFSKSTCCGTIFSVVDTIIPTCSRILNLGNFLGERLSVASRAALWNRGLLPAGSNPLDLRAHPRVRPLLKEAPAQ